MWDGLFWSVDYKNVCYLIHFDKPIGGSKAQHYIGFTTDLQNRVASHRAATGSGLTGRANKIGVSWRVVRVWRGADLESEKALKRLGGVNLCPICSKMISRPVKSRSRGERSENEVTPFTVGASATTDY